MTKNLRNFQGSQNLPKKLFVFCYFSRRINNPKVINFLSNYTILLYHRILLFAFTPVSVSFFCLSVMQWERWAWKGVRVLENMQRKIKKPLRNFQG